MSKAYKVTLTDEQARYVKNNSLDVAALTRRAIDNRMKSKKKAQKKPKDSLENVFALGFA
jgi:post-segregation antitoxin (ccd killing protein)